jgi:hypothetical protein
MADAPEIKVKITAEDAGVSAAIKELTSQLKNLKKQQDETAGSGLSLKKAFEGIVLAAGALELGRIGKEAFDSAIDIGKMADKTGLSTQTLSVFHHVAEEVGVSTEGVDKALIKAAKSITEFQQGTGKAAVSFKALGITQKDFIGLKPDAMLALVTTRLGQMSASFQKTAVTAALFGARAGTDIIPVANAIAGEGFDKITASVSRLGLLLDQDTTDSFRAAKASLQELSDAGKGMATQFEAGLLPAISDVGDAILDALGDDGAGGAFRDMGHLAGTVIASIAFGLLSVGATAGHAAAEIEEVFDYAFNHTKEFAKTTFAAIGGYITGGTAGAAGAASVQLLSATDDETKEFTARLAAIDDDAKKQQAKIYASLFPSDEEAAKRKKERISRLRPDQKEAPAIDSSAPTGAAAKAALALLEKQMQDQLAVHRAYAKQTEQVDKEMYDTGLLSIHEYFERKRAAILSDSEEEIAIVEKGLEAAKASVAKAADAKLKAATPKEADVQEGARLAALGKVDELETKITELRVTSGTKIQALNDEQFKQTDENNAKVAAFEKKQADSQGKRLEGVKAELAVEVKQYELSLQKQGVDSPEQIKAKVSAFAQFATAQAAFQDEQKSGADAIKVLDDQKAAIEDKVQNGKLFQLQADQQILDLYRQQLPALQLIADQMTANAKTEDEVAQAADFQAKVDKVKTATNIAGQQMKTLRAGVQESLTTGLSGAFDMLFQGTQNVGLAFRNLASSVVSSIAKMIAQMYIQLLVTKLLKAAMGGFSGGGSVGGVAGGLNTFGAAEGGLITGPGGPKSDSIPARLSHGEYVVKASAVDTIGVRTLDAINRGMGPFSIASAPLMQFGEGGLVGSSAGAGGGGDSNINLGISLDEGLILKHLSSKAAGNIILQHLTNNPKAAGKALSRSS